MLHSGIGREKELRREFARNRILVLVLWEEDDNKPNKTKTMLGENETISAG
jgi:hypothetical protein